MPRQACLVLAGCSGGPVASYQNTLGQHVANEANMEADVQQKLSVDRLALSGEVGPMGGYVTTAGTTITNEWTASVPPGSHDLAA